MSNYNNQTKITVIGSNGGTGAAIIDQLILSGYTNIKGITLSGEEKWGRNLEVVKCDALILKELLEATAGSEVIFGAFNASEYSDKSWGEEFPVFITNLIECGRANKSKLIFLDNLYSYKNQKGLKAYDENTLIIPYGPKARIRQSVEQKFIDGLKEFGIEGNIIKSSDLYGPYALNGVIGDRYFGKLFKDNVAEIIPLGNKLHSFTYTLDVGRLAVSAMESIQPLIIHTPNTAPIGYEDLVRITFPFLDSQPKESIAPMFIFRILAVFVAPIKSMLAMMYQWDHDYVINSIYNQDFIPTKLEVGVKSTVEWFRLITK